MLLGIVDFKDFVGDLDDKNEYNFFFKEFFCFI